MGRKRHPRRGSMQFWPRVRAKRQYPRIRNWNPSTETLLQGFIGYKAGMTQIFAKDNQPKTLNSGKQIRYPVTIIECPPLKIYGYRFYQNTADGLKVIQDVVAGKTEKELKRKLIPSQKKNNAPEVWDELKLLVYTQPKKTGIGKKKPELLEMVIGGNKEDQLKYAQEILNKEIKVSEILKNGQLVDAHGISKGKGFQGTVKRFGIPIRSHKAEKTKRGIGTLGPWHPNKVSIHVAQAGKMGNHQRTEYNKQIVLIDNDISKINPKGGFIRYGLIKNDYILVKGSIVGPKKRTIVLTTPQRPNKNVKQQAYEISYISTRSQQRR